MKKYLGMLCGILLLLATSVHAQISNNYCVFSNQIASLNPSTQMAYANKKLTFTTTSLQLPGGGSTLPIGPSTEVCQTDPNGVILSGCQVQQGAHVNLSVGNGPPIPLVIPFSNTCDLTAIMLSQTDPPEVVSAVAVAGPLFAGTTVSNPPPGTIGTSVITSPPAFSQSQSSSATVDVGINGPTQQVIMTGNSVTISLTDFVNGAGFTVDTTQDATGGRTPTFTVPGGWTLAWSTGGAQPALPSAIGGVHTIWNFNAYSGSVLVGSLGRAAPGSFPLTQDANFNGYAGNNVGSINLVQQPPPSNFTATATCSGTCATTYTYDLTCLTTSGESNPVSTTVSNAAALSVSNFNVLTWTFQSGCTLGYNVYGRIGGSLGLLANIGDPTMLTWTDNGTPANPANIYTFKFSSAAYPSISIWDLSGAATMTPIDVFQGSSFGGGAPQIASITTTINHDTWFGILGIDRKSVNFTGPAGFTNTAAVTPSTNAYGLWLGEKDKATAGATGTAFGSQAPPNPWTSLSLGVKAANSGVAITIGNNTTTSASAPYTSITFGDPSGASTGDLEIVCVSFLQSSSLQLAAGATAFKLISSVVGLGSGNVQLNCYWNAPTVASLPPPPTVNLTGILTQTTPGGAVYNEVLLGLLPWTANSANLPNGTTAIMSSTKYPMPLTVQACRATWNSLAACSPFPTFAIKDTTADVILCSSGTTSGSNTDQDITPSNFSVPANDVIAFLASSAGTSCSAGETSMTIILHQ